MKLAKECIVYSRLIIIIIIIIIVIIIIIIIIKRGRRCKAGRESDLHPISLTTPSPTIQTYSQKEEKGKKSRRQKRIEQLRPMKKHWPCSWNLPVIDHRIQGQQDQSTGILRGK